MNDQRRRSRHPGIRILESGSYQVLFRDPTGRQRARSFPTLRDAKAFQDGTRADLRKGTWIDPAGGEVRLAEWTTLWLETRRVQPTTAAKTQTLLNHRILPTLGAVPLGRITRRAVQLWVQDLESAGLAAAYVQSCYALLAQVMAEAVNEDLLAQSPCRGIRFDPGSRSPRRPRALSTAEAARLLGALSQPHRTLVLGLLGTGLRWGEATGLRRGRVHLLRRPPHLEVAESLHQAGGMLYFGPPKTRASVRRVPLPGVVAQALAAHLPPNGEPDDLVFTTPRGRPWRRQNFGTQVWLPARTAAALPTLRLHDLRHTYTSWLADAGIPEVIIAAVLGHRVGPSITAHYTQVLAGFEARVLEVLDERLSVAEGGVGVGG
jgi:integrase